MTKLIHGQEGLDQALRITDALFKGDIASLSAKEIEMAFSDFPKTHIEENAPLLETLIALGVASSKREAREFVKNGAITINGQKVTDETTLLNPSMAIDQRFLVVRRGKKKYSLAEF